jgi:putative NIF3 family GTP cyclohydrolase 1 type 2
MIPTSQVVSLLDREFRVEQVGDPCLVKYALSDVGRACVTKAFLDEKSGLMFDFAQTTNKVYGVVFTTAEIFDFLLATANKPSLIFTHHPHDYHEDARGFGLFPEKYLHDFKKKEIAVYTIHLPLDVGRSICVSKSLAERLSLSGSAPFYATSGGHLGVIGFMYTADLNTLAKHVCVTLGVNSVDVFDNGGKGNRTAIVAGGGDQPEILRKAKDLGCSNYITGTVVHRWALEPVQHGNKEFHSLAREWKINLIGASHYHTEKCAVQDVIAFLEKTGLDAEFIADPVLEKYLNGNWRN